MDKIIKTEVKLCPCCIETHEVQTVKTCVIEHYKGKTIRYDAVCYYCANADEYYEDEDMMRENHEKMVKIYETGKDL